MRRALAAAIRRQTADPVAPQPPITTATHLSPALSPRSRAERELSCASCFIVSMIAYRLPLHFQVEREQMRFAGRAQATVLATLNAVLNHRDVEKNQTEGIVRRH